MFIRRLIAITVILLLSVPSSVLAAGNETRSETYQLGEMVVKGEQKGVEDIAIHNEITAQEIEATGSNTLAEALKFAPGIVVTSGAKNEPSVSIHGFPSENVLFLIDGIPYYETNYGKLNLDQIPTNIISKIQITKNAPSVLYGPNGMAGVVNVITKQGTEEPSASFTAEFGENDTHREGFSHGNQIGNINYWLSYEHFETDGWELSEDYDPKEVKTVKGPYKGNKILEDGGLRENSDKRSDKFWARTGYVPDSGSQYYVSFFYSQSEFGAPPSNDLLKYFPFGPDAFTQFWRFDEYEDYSIDISGKQEITERLTLRGKLFYHNHEDVNQFYNSTAYNDVLATSTFKDDYYGGNIVADFSVAPWYSAHLSFMYRQDKHEERDAKTLPYNEYNSHTGSVGTEHEFQLPWRLTAVFGASYDWFKFEDGEVYTDSFGQKPLETSDTTGEFNPMFGLTYTMNPSTEFFASVARKTRFPTLQDLGDNPDLDSQSSINYSLGGSTWVGSVLELKATGYYHDIEDWITDEFYNNNKSLNYPINTGEIRIIGAEFGFTLQPVQDLSFTAMHNIQDVENESPGAIVDEVRGFYENKTDLKLSYLIPYIDTKLDMQGLFVGATTSQVPTPDNQDQELIKTDNYFLLRGKLSKQFSEHVKGYMEVDNIQDRDYEQEVGYPGRGRSFLVGIEASL